MLCNKIANCQSYRHREYQTRLPSYTDDIKTQAMKIAYGTKTGT